MPRYFPCPYLATDVDLTDEREAHILAEHAEMSGSLIERLAATLAEPEIIKRTHSGERLFARWYDDLLRGKFFVAVVVDEASDERKWIVTAYVARRMTGGAPEWTRG